jgi:hypothetical protein
MISRRLKALQPRTNLKRYASRSLRRCNICSAGNSLVGLRFLYNIDARWHVTCLRVGAIQVQGPGFWRTLNKQGVIIPTNSPPTSLNPLVTCRQMLGIPELC